MSAILDQVVTHCSSKVPKRYHTLAVCYFWYRSYNACIARCSVSLTLGFRCKDWIWDWKILIKKACLYFYEPTYDLFFQAKKHCVIELTINITCLNKLYWSFYVKIDYVVNRSLLLQTANSFDCTTFVWKS